MRVFLGVLLDHPELLKTEGATKLNEALNQRGLSQLRFLPRLALVTDSANLVTEDEARALTAVRVYAELVVTMKAYHGVREPEIPEVLRARLLTAVQTAVDLLHDAPEWLLSAATFRDPDEYRVVHSVNMCLLVLCLGHRVELSRKSLMNLGLAALYADSGLRLLDFDLTMAPGGRDAMERHPLLSVAEILQTPALTRAQRDRIVVAYEHHTGRDGSGYPPRISGKPKHLFSSLVGIVDRFDELSSERHGAAALPAPEAMEAMNREIAHHDPRLLAIFFHMMGPYPVGTVLELSTGEVAVVFRPATDHRFVGRPLVKIARDAEGRQVPPTLFDLCEGSAEGDFLAHIRRVLPPSGLGGMTPAQVLFFQDEGIDGTERPRWD